MLLTDESGVAMGNARAFGAGRYLHLLRGSEVFVVADW
jgi:hypothetical protein